jgi:hypothetical protein
MFKDILVNRIGTSTNSYMKTVKVIKTIQPNIYYKILLNNLMEIQELKSYDFLKSYNTKILDKIIEPKYIEIEDNWILESHTKLNDANILGSFGKLITESIIKIPINIANYYNVQFYNAKLYNSYDIMKFDSEEDLPLTEMVIGDEYVKNYIYDINLGGGQYLEYHNNPHFHSPISSNGGYYILGKRENNKIKLSAFTIPYCKAIYTPDYVIHSDANLIGKWLVVYSKTNKYSTVLLRDKKDNLTKIEFL